MNHKTAFPIGSHVWYTPGKGAYGIVPDLARRSPDGQVKGEVVGHTESRIRCLVKIPEFGQQTVTVYPQRLVTAGE